MAGQPIKSLAVHSYHIFSAVHIKGQAIHIYSKLAHPNKRKRKYA
jgi:hypothetical protein